MRDVREEFVERVKAIDPIFDRGDLESFWPVLRGLMAMAPDRRDLSQKKSHYLASLAARSLRRGEPDTALRFLDYAENVLDPSHLTAFLFKERAEFRLRVEDAMRQKKPPSP